MFFKYKKGLDLPLKGQPDERIDVFDKVQTVAVLGGDYVGLKPTMLVKVDDAVKIGTPLFEDKKNPGVVVTSPASGIVSAINRGAKRALISVEIKVTGDEAEQFESVAETDLINLSEEKARALLQKAGQWTSFRTRPYGKVPTVDSTPNSIFVNAMDTNPLAVDPQFIIGEHASEFANGVMVLSKFGVPVYVCQEKSAKLPDLSASGATLASFSGPHPAGLSSTHVHSIDPVNANKTVWTVGYQDVIAMGKLFVDGRLSTQRYVALGGPLVNSPRVFATCQGVNVSELIEGRTIDGRTRVVSGSVFNGHTAAGHTDFLGRYDNQVTVIEENDDREFMGWITPGLKRYSKLNVFLSSLIRPKAYDITSSQNGSPRAIVPIGVYEKVMPLDILPTPLIRSILVKDTDAAQELGCLELVEEDMSLCTFVDPGKHDFGPVLRTTLTQIEREG
ncbi:MAG: Na(+)-translocating NADH-quinone reductase subunit A [Pseudomonadota bacterium]